MTTGQLIKALAERSGMTAADARLTVQDLVEIITEAVERGENVNLGGLVSIKMKVRPARPAGKYRNPFNGEMEDKPRRPVSLAVGARPLKPLKEAVPDPKSRVGKILIAEMSKKKDK